MDKIISLLKRRGFIFPSSEIYGGFAGVYDFGPLGFELKKNIKDSWLKNMKQEEGILGFDSGILMNPKVWKASGHLDAGFADELVECKKCHKRFKNEALKQCPECKGELTKPKQFNLMMKTNIGPVGDNISYLRPETCQGIFINFLNILNSQRLKLPFGIVQIGKSFRNEITPKNYVFRTREFEQMEMEWFCDPKQADRWFEFFLDKRLKWYYDLGISKKNLRTVEVPKKDRAHYALRQIDIEHRFEFGWKEIEGIHNRGDWDLSNHSKHSSEELKYDGYYPYIIETSVGVERSLLAFLCEAYTEVKGGRSKESNKEVEIVLKIAKELAPIQIAVFPLVRNNPKIVQKAREIYEQLRKDHACIYDETGSIGRRYRRIDEIGALYAITVDFDTLEDNKITIRNRDTMKQKRIKILEISKHI